MRYWLLTAAPILFSISTRAKAPTVSPAAIAAVPAYFRTGVLDFESRVWAQTQIERVYYNHRTWPKENPGGKPPFERLVPPESIEKKVTETQRMSAALKRYWNVEITPPMLQMELDRMVRDSKDRLTLRELFTALGNDPFLIAETLARGTLTEQRLRSQFAWDGAIHGDERRRVSEIAADVNNGAAFSDFPANYSRHRVRLDDDLPRQDRAADPETAGELRLSARELSGLRHRLIDDARAGFREDENGWLLERVIAEDGDGIEFESLFVPKRRFDAWWERTVAGQTFTLSTAEQPSGKFSLSAPTPLLVTGCDAWNTKINHPVPTARQNHSAVWTGSEMIVWGGYDSGNYVNTGGRYTPATDSWHATSTSGSVPSARIYQTAVWSGSEMIVWGGLSSGYLSTGGRYNPVTDIWAATSSGANVPVSRANHTAVWSGSEMIIWGGFNGGFLYFGSRYNPATDSWLTMSFGANTPSARAYHTAIWTGSVMIVWGGGNGSIYFNDGGRYNPVTNSWLATSTGVGVPDVRIYHTAIWTGSEMIVWGGVNATYLNDGARYNPVTDGWAAMSVGAGVPAPRQDHIAIWSGSVMIVWGGANGSILNDGGRYDPAADGWVATSTGTNAPAARQFHTAVWTGSEMIVWGGYDGVTKLNTGGRYSPGTDSWLTTSLGTNIPVSRYLHSAVWTGSEMIVWGGYNGVTELDTGGRYNPAIDSWSVTSTGANVPSARDYHSAVWTGSEMIVWGGGVNNIGASPTNTGGQYNPATDSWIPTGFSGSPPVSRRNHVAVWTGSEMIVWGGRSVACSPICTPVELQSGGRYNPPVGGWAATSPPAPANLHGYYATAVWTGSEMIVWSSGSNLYGGRYNPSSNSWSATAANSVPATNTGHTAIWTGGEMIVWGGAAYRNTGQRYNPAADSWTSTSVGFNVPAPRSDHTAVWTGSEMIVWGGKDGSGDFNTGGRYNPVSDTWLPTSIGSNLPAARYSHTAIWTGGEMLVWGGKPSGTLNPTPNGGTYVTGSAGSPGNSLRGGKSATIDLSWAAVTGAATYNVKRCPGACIPAAIVATPASNGYSEPVDPSSYFYAVEAVNSCGATP